MSKYCDYQNLIDTAMRNVIKTILRQVEENGLLNGHYFFINFKTTFPGVKISERLKAQYEEEMVIILQYQFDDLAVHEKYFSISLTFNAVKELLVIPFASIIEFNDPSVSFLIQLDNEDWDKNYLEKSNNNEEFLNTSEISGIKKEGNLIDITEMLKKR
jgi:hypothetical protein